MPGSLARRRGQRLGDGRGACYPTSRVWFATHAQPRLQSALTHRPAAQVRARGKGLAARATLLNHWTLTFVPEDHNLELRTLRERAVVHQPVRVSQAPAVAQCSKHKSAGSPILGQKTYFFTNSTPRHTDHHIHHALPYIMSAAKKQKTSTQLEQLSAVTLVVAVRSCRCGSHQRARPDLARDGLSQRCVHTCGSTRSILDAHCSPLLATATLSPRLLNGSLSPACCVAPVFPLSPPTLTPVLYWSRTYSSRFIYTAPPFHRPPHRPLPTTPARTPATLTPLPNTSRPMRRRTRA